MTISHGYGDFRAAFDWTGTDDPTPVLCLPNAIELLGGWLGSWDALRTNLNQRAKRGQQLILARLGLSAPAPASMTGHLAVIAMPGRSEVGPFRQDPLHAWLYDEHRIEVPVTPWRNPDLRLLRISAHLYNDDADYQRLADALSDAVG